MESSLLSFPDIIDELRYLGRSKVTGSLFIVSDEKHYATVGFENGRIISLQYRLSFGESAIPMLAKINHGSCRFQNTSNFIRKTNFNDNEEVFQKIMEARNDGKNKEVESIDIPNMLAEQIIGDNARKGQALYLSSQQKIDIEDVLIEELGPIGAIVMDSLVMCHDLGSMLNIIREEVEQTDVAREVIHHILDILTQDSEVKVGNAS
ncbi:MAG: hypothetical protein P8179_19415 [Candidatus Thiodiazotropha sp.]|jgi:hypothetical protein